MKVKDIKPGMLIQRKLTNGYSDVTLITSIRARHLKTIECSYFGVYDSDHMVSTFHHKDKVKLIIGEKRKKLIKSIISEVFQRQHDAERDVETIRLILSMDEQNEKN